MAAAPTAAVGPPPKGGYLAPGRNGGLGQEQSLAKDRFEVCLGSCNTATFACPAPVKVEAAEPRKLGQPPSAVAPSAYANGGVVLLSLSINALALVPCGATRARRDQRRGARTWWVLELAQPN